MRAFSVSVIGAAMAAAIHGIAAADGLPELDVVPSCRIADRVSLSGEPDKAIQACLDDERTAKEDLVKRWTSFSRADQTLCVGMNRTGGPSSYVELLTCLEMMRDAAAGTTE
jgi:hypothetical protein